MRQERWYVTFPGLNIITLLPPRVSEEKAADVAVEQARILEQDGATLKSTKRMYANAERNHDDSPRAG